MEGKCNMHMSEIWHSKKNDCRLSRTQVIRLLPLQGVGLVWRIFTQGVALGYVLLPLRGVLLVSFDTLSSYSLIKPLLITYTSVLN